LYKPRFLQPLSTALGWTSFGSLSAVVGGSISTG